MPIQDCFSIYCHMWVVGFSLPPFVLLHMYVKYLISSKKPVKHSTVVPECSRSNSEFPDCAERSPAGQSLLSSSPPPHPHQIQPEDSAFTCQDFCLWAHTGFQVKQCQGETAAINTINRNPAECWLPAWVKANLSFQERSPPAPDAAEQSTCSWDLPCHRQRGSHFWMLCVSWAGSHREIAQSNQYLPDAWPELF